IGYCGNTCWSAQPNDTLTDGADTPQEIFNRIYKADVTSTVMGNGDYCIDGLPYTPEPIAVNGANNAQYPGCAGSQGAALFIIWEWPT
ncbi:hypothetical protein, partial [Klebsiella pneumoniae]|uniref:hypothetical protein n=1 Tax=Klebsiella pneumoniae TaxID=573 RepID=UPI003EE06E19